MKTALILFLLTVLSISLYAQDNFTKGYIITHDQDTIWGMIDLRLDKMNSYSCRFQPDSDSTPIIYYPQDIAGYRFTDEGKYYISRKITIDEHERLVFLEYLVQGLMNLYFYSLEEQDYFFFENQDGDMIPVTQKPEQIKENKIIPDRRYVGTVRYIFKDYDAIGKQTKDLKFNQKDFIKVAKSYHDAECTTGEECIIFENKRPDYTGDKVKYSVYTGVQLSTFIPCHVVDIKSDPTSNLSPIIGAQFKFINPRWSKSISGQLDFSLSWFNNTSDAIHIRSSKIYSPPNIYKYNATALSGRVGARYTHLKTKLHPTIEGGLAFSYLLVHSSKYRSASYANVKDNSKFMLDYSLKKHYLGFYGAIGLEYNTYKEQAVFMQLVFEAYLRTKIIADTVDDNIRMPQIKIGYTF